MNFDIYLGDEKVRYLLGSSGERPCFVLGVNPSTATPDSPDQTIKKVGSFIQADCGRGLAHHGFLMLNLYPIRSTDPDNLPNSTDWSCMIQNHEAVRKVLEKVRRPIIWAAWGDLIDSRGYLIDCLAGICEVVKPFNPIWKRRGDLTQSGNPRHPCRQSFAARLHPFKVGDYLLRKRNL